MANVSNLTRESSEKPVNKSSMGDDLSLQQRAEETLAKSIESGKESVTHWMDEAGPKIKMAYHDAEKGVNQAIQGVNSTIRKYPIGAISIGFAVGCATGFLVKSATKKVTG